MKEKLMIFPYNKDAISLLYVKELIANYDLSIMCSFKEDKHVMMKELKDLNVMVTVEFEKALEKVQVVLFCDNLLNIDLSSYFSKITFAYEKGKKILISRKLFKDLSINFSIMNKIEGDLEIIENTFFEELTIKKRILYPIKAPVVCIYGFGEDCDKFNTHIAVSNKMKEKNYKCLNIFSNSLGQLLDSKILPNFMYSDALSINMKIQMFNKYVYELEQVFSPDVIVISSPFGIMPRNIYISNDFGEESMVISNALDIDVAILCIDFVDSISEEYCEELKKLLKYKFSTSLSTICISSVKKRFRFDDRVQENYYLSNNFSSNNVKSKKIEIGEGYTYYSFDKKNQDRCIEKVISELEDNANIF